MSAYWIGRAQMMDPEGYVEYGKLVQIAAEKHSNEVLVRAGEYRVLEGPDDFNRHVILKFSSIEAAIQYYNSPEYQAAAAVRRAASGRSEIVVSRGID